MKAITVTAVLTVIIASVAFVSAETRGTKGWEEETSWLADLNLTPEQTEKVLKLRSSYLEDKNSLRNQMVNKRMEVKLLWMRLKPDPNTIRAKEKEIHDLRWQLREKRTEYRLAFRNILTPEQLSKYVILEQGSMRSKRKKKK